MRFILGLIIFWFSVLGIKKYLEDKFKIEPNFTLAITFSLIGTIIFIAGILNIMKLTAILIILVSCGYLIYSLFKEKRKLKKEIKKLNNPTVIIITLIFAYITIVGIGMHLTHYDNFSHWGLIIKNIFMNNSLPNFETPITFKGYQPGSACFIYLFGLLCGKTEGCMIVAQNYLIFAFLTPLFAFVKDKNKWLKRLIIIALYIFTMTVSIRFNDLLVDSLIATMTITSLSIIYYYRNNLKKAFMYSLPISIFLLLVKNTGLLLAGINCLAILYTAFKSKELKQGVKYVTITVLILLAFLIIWQGHVKLVFGDLALNSKHSMSAENIILSLRTKGWDKIFTFIKDYFLHFFTLKNNIPNIFILIINAFLITFIFTDKKEKKSLLTLLLIIDLIYLGYYGVLGIMYLLSMPWEEAVQFAGYERYMMTILIVIIGIIFIYLLKYKERNNNFKILGTLIIISMLSTMYFYKSNTIALLGNDGYENTLVERYDNIITNIPIDNNQNYYIYSPSSENDFSYMYYMTRYKLNVSKVEVVHNKEELDGKQNGILVFVEEDETAIEQIKHQGWKKQNKVVYIK